ncbi:MAG TPA: hypothetical protein P5179_13195 [Candidatus Latescibacteria bacterium]|nr:hypothetical protein [Candidatus Latescibacterota bacterium]
MVDTNTPLRRLISKYRDRDRATPDVGFPIHRILSTYAYERALWFLAVFRMVVGFGAFSIGVMGVSELQGAEASLACVIAICGAFVSIGYRTRWAAAVLLLIWLAYSFFDRELWPFGIIWLAVGIVLLAGAPSFSVDARRAARREGRTVPDPSDISGTLE